MVIKTHLKIRTGETQLPKVRQLKIGEKLKNENRRAYCHCQKKRLFAEEKDNREKQMYHSRWYFDYLKDQIC